MNKVEKKSYTCIICPNGCEISAEFERRADGSTRFLAAEGQACKRGERYVQKELESPERTIDSTVPVEGGVLPLASVRITTPIPKGRIPEAMQEIRKYRLKAPVKAGTVLNDHFLGLEVSLIVTKHVEEAGDVG